MVVYQFVTLVIQLLNLQCTSVKVVLELGLSDDTSSLLQDLHALLLLLTTFLLICQLVLYARQVTRQLFQLLLFLLILTLDVLVLFSGV